MHLASFSLRDYITDQLRGLCQVAGFTNTETAVSILDELLGHIGDRPLSEPPVWPSDVADDQTPVEFSIALDRQGVEAVRVLGEAIAEKPSEQSNMRAAQQLLESLAPRHDLALDRFHTVRDLFLPDEPSGKFAMWYSMVLRANTKPDIKIYFNPEVRGADQAPRLVREGLNRLGLGGAYNWIVEHGCQRGNLDQFSFFALDLHSRARSRVKVYISHQLADVHDVTLAAKAIPGIDVGQIEDFCQLMVGSGPFDGRPLISSYTFVENDTDRPSSYSLYLPIRDYITDDEVARTRVRTLLNRSGVDPATVDRAISTVARRPLRDGVGLIAHVSLRIDPVKPGITVYLSSEAYGVTPPRRRSAAGEPAMA